MTELRAGIWRHYKGPLYLVLGLAHDANAGELRRMRSARMPLPHVVTVKGVGCTLTVRIGPRSYDGDDD